MKLTTAPGFRLIDPTFKLSGLAVAFAFKLIAELPAFKVRLGNRWLLVVLALPVSESVEPPSIKAEELAVLLSMLLAGAPVVLKLRASVAHADGRVAGISIRAEQRFRSALVIDKAVLFVDPSLMTPPNVLLPPATVSVLSDEPVVERYWLFQFRTWLVPPTSGCAV